MLFVFTRALLCGGFVPLSLWFDAGSMGSLGPFLILIWCFNAMRTPSHCTGFVFNLTGSFARFLVRRWFLLGFTDMLLYDRVTPSVCIPVIWLMVSSGSLLNLFYYFSSCPDTLAPCLRGLWVIVWFGSAFSVQVSSLTFGYIHVSFSFRVIQTITPLIRFGSVCRWSGSAGSWVAFYMTVVKHSNPPVTCSGWGLTISVFHSLRFRGLVL